MLQMLLLCLAGGYQLDREPHSEPVGPARDQVERISGRQLISRSTTSRYAPGVAKYKVTESFSKGIGRQP